MAYRKDKTGSLQTATNVAGAVVQTLIEAGAIKFAASKKADVVIEETFGHIDDLTQRIFTPLAEQVDADNALFEEAEKEEAKSGRSAGRSSGNAGRRSSGGGGGGGSSKVSLEDASATELTWGAFKGISLGEIAEMSKRDVEDAGVDYAGSGKRYLAWLSKNQDNNYMASRAKVVLASLRDGGDDEE